MHLIQVISIFFAVAAGSLSELETLAVGKNSSSCYSDERVHSGVLLQRVVNQEKLIPPTAHVQPDITEQVLYFFSYSALTLLVGFILVIKGLTGEEAEGQPLEEAVEEPPVDYAALTKNMIGMSITVTFCCALLYIQELISILFIAGNGTSDLASLGVGILVVNIGCNMLSSGFASTFGTFLSQAHGSGNKELCIRYLQMSRSIFLGLFVFSVCIMFSSKELLLWSGQDLDVASKASTYCIGIIPAIFLGLHVGGTNMYYMNTGAPEFPTTVAAFGCLLHPFLCAFFIWHLDMGILGATYAININAVLQFLLSLSLLSQSVEGDGHEFWELMRTGTISWTEFVEFMKFAFAGIVQSCSHFFFTGAATLLMANFGKSALAGQVAVDSVIHIVLTLLVGQMITTGTLVGQQVGAHKPKHAKAVAAISALYIAAAYSVLAIPFAIAPEWVARFYTKDATSIALVGEVLPWYYLCGFFSSIHIVSVGAMEGLGLRNAVLTIETYLYSLVGLPIVVLAVFYFKVSLIGVLVSYTMVDIFGALLCSTFLSLTEWKKLDLVTKASQMM